LVRNLLLLLMLLAALAVAAGVIWRHLALEAAGRFTLDRFGFDQAELTVTEVGFRRIIVEQLTLGPGLPSFARAELDFEPMRLLEGRIEQVSVTGLRVLVEGEGENLRELVRKFGHGTSPGSEGIGPGGDQAEERQLVLPAVSLTDTVLELRGTPIGDGEVRLAGDMALAGDDMHADMRATLETGFATARLVLQTNEDAQGRMLTVEASGMVDAEGMHAAPAIAAEAGRWIAAGQADFALNGTAALPEFSAGKPSELLVLLADRLQAAGKVELTGVRTAFAPEIVDGALGWTVEGTAGQWRWAMPEPGAFIVSGIGAERWRAFALGLPAEEPLRLAVGPAGGTIDLRDGIGQTAWTGSGAAAANIADANVTLSVQAMGEAGSPRVALQAVRLQASALPVHRAGVNALLDSLDLTAAGSVRQPGDLDLKGHVQGRLSGVTAAQGTLDDASLSGAFTVHGPASAVKVQAADIAAVLNGVALPGLVRADGPVTVSGKQVRYDGEMVEADIAVAAGSAEVLAAGGGEPVPVAWESIAADVSMQALADEEHALGGVVTVVGASAPVPEAGITISEAQITLPLADGPLRAALRLSDESGQRRFTPVQVTLEGKRQGQAVTASGGASLHRGQARMPLAMTADLAGKSADVRFGPGVLAFETGKMQPSDLSVMAKKVGQVSGKMTISGRAQIAPAAAPAIRASVMFDALSAVLDGGVSIDGLNGDLTFGSLQPLATAGEQRLTIRRLVAGVPLEDADARFTIRPDRGGFAVELSEAGATLSGGQVRVGRALYRNGSADLQVGIADLALERLLADWKVQGLEGTGIIAGSLPVSIRPGGVAIDRGQLMSMTPGVIRVDFGSARQTLAGAGSQVELAVQTLENFHYESLTLGVSKPLDGDLSLAVGLDGKNPDVLDGYPFRFNVNLSGRLEPILEAIQAGERISMDLLQGGFAQ
jgi:hypothetical protein